MKMATLSVVALMFLSTTSAQAGEFETVLGKIRPNPAAMSCPVLVEENQAVYCAKFAFVNAELQIQIAKFLSGEILESCGRLTKEI